MNAMQSFKWVMIAQRGWKKWSEIIKLVFDRVVTKWKSLAIRAKLRRPTSFSWPASF
jgi:hypothetical protein